MWYTRDYDQDHKRCELGLMGGSDERQTKAWQMALPVQDHLDPRLEPFSKRAYRKS